MKRITRWIGPLLIIQLLLILTGCEETPIDELLITPRFKKNQTYLYSVFKTSKTTQQRMQSYTLNLSVTEKSYTGFEITGRYIPENETEKTAAYNAILKTMRLDYLLNPNGRLRRLSNTDELKSSYNKLLNAIIIEGGYDMVSSSMLEQMGLDSVQFRNMYLEEIEILYAFYNILLKKNVWLDAGNPFVLTNNGIPDKAGVSLNSVDQKKKTAHLTLAMRILRGQQQAEATTTDTIQSTEKLPVSEIAWKIDYVVNYKTGIIEELHAIKITNREPAFTQTDDLYMKLKK